MVFQSKGLKLNRRNNVSCALTNQEAKEFEAFTNAMDFVNINQAIKYCIAYTIENNKKEERRSA
jgi:hypothetical protein